MISAALFVSFSIRNYIKDSNHNAIVAAWVSLLGMYACALDRYGYKLVGDSLEVYNASRAAMLAAILNLLNEMKNSIDSLENLNDSNKVDYNEIYLSGKILSDRIIWNSRALKSMSLLSLVIIEEKQKKSILKLDKKQKQAIQKLMKPEVTTFKIWGEAAIPQLIAYALARRLEDPTFQPNMIYYGILKYIAQRNLHDKDGFIPSPYHKLIDCLKSEIGYFSNIKEDDVKSETEFRSSYFAEAILHCFVRTNLKSHVKYIWPDMTKLMHNSFIPEHRWQYGLWRTERGRNQSRQLQHCYKWKDLQCDAASINTPNIPSQLRHDPIVLLAFTIYYPHRAIPEVIRFLDYRICGTWFCPFQCLNRLLMSKCCFQPYHFQIRNGPLPGRWGGGGGAAHGIQGGPWIWASRDRQGKADGCQRRLCEAMPLDRDPAD